MSDGCWQKSAFEHLATAHSSPLLTLVRVRATRRPLLLLFETSADAVTKCEPGSDGSRSVFGTLPHCSQS